MHIEPYELKIAKRVPWRKTPDTLIEQMTVTESQMLVGLRDEQSELARKKNEDYYAIAKQQEAALARSLRAVKVDSVTESIQSATCAVTGVTQGEIEGMRKTGRLVRARQIFLVLSRKHTKQSYSKISDLLGGRNDAQMRGIYKRAVERLPELHSDMKAIEYELKKRGVV